MITLAYGQNLKSLPVLPLSLSYLDASGCKSLETMSGISKASLKQNWDDLYTNKSFQIKKFLFIGCEKLDENARKLLMDDAQLRIFRFATLRSKYKYFDDLSQVYIHLFLYRRYFRCLKYDNDSYLMMLCGTERTLSMLLGRK